MSWGTGRHLSDADPDPDDRTSENPNVHPPEEICHRCDEMADEGEFLEEVDGYPLCPSCLKLKLEDDFEDADELISQAIDDAVSAMGEEIDDILETAGIDPEVWWKGSSIALRQAKKLGLKP